MKALHVVFSLMLLIYMQHVIPFSRDEQSKLSAAAIYNNPYAIPYEIIISEIMADPDPNVLLPDAEYIELYNRSNQTINISGWHINIGSKSKILSYGIIEPESFCILCDSKIANDFIVYGNTIAVEGFPAILNSGQTLTLKNQNGTIIHTVSFSDRCYTSSFKKEGGWSLEIIDPDNPCGSYNNWSESNNYRGGTPGSLNSVHAENPDIQQPVLLRATYNTTDAVELHFNENMDSASMTSRHYYSTNHDLLHPCQIQPVGPDYASVILCYPENFNPDNVYKIMVLDSLSDCAGNFLEKNAVVDYAIPQSADSFDIVINEILFDASDNLNEFIELYNRSLKIIDLSSFCMGLLDPFTLKIKKLVSFKEYAHLLFPGGYLAITTDKTNLQKITENAWQRNMAEIPELFSLPDDEGLIVLLDMQMHCIDKLIYSRDMHVDLLNTVEGVSLERIRPDGSSQDIGNWHSASELSGFATPGYQNSQMLTYEMQADDMAICPEIFSPDNDGYNDCVNIYLNSNESGFIANVIIFDKSGQRIRTLASNMLCGKNSCITWDGRNDQNATANIGIYIIYVELFNTQGILKTYKRAVTLVKTLH